MNLTAFEGSLAFLQRASSQLLRWNALAVQSQKRAKEKKRYARWWACYGGEITEEDCGGIGLIKGLHYWLKVPGRNGYRVITAYFFLSNSRFASAARSASSFTAYSLPQYVFFSGFLSQDCCFFEARDVIDAC